MSRDERPQFAGRGNLRVGHTLKIYFAGLPDPITIASTVIELFPRYPWQPLAIVEFAATGNPFLHHLGGEMFQADAIRKLSMEWSELTDLVVQECDKSNRTAKFRDFLHVIQDIRYGRNGSMASQEQPPDYQPVTK